MKETSTAAEHKIANVEGQKLTSGLDLGDRSSWHCVLNETGEVLLELWNGSWRQRRKPSEKSSALGAWLPLKY
jgi:hypothetical protein